MPLRLSPSRILRAASSPPSTNTTPVFKWSTTLNLPKSSFPARASAAELQKYRQRCADELYAWQGHARQGQGHDVKEFVLHDGPPYANGSVHVGHALNKILKDLILRWELARGKRVRYRPGWDCHGLPIELKALQQRVEDGVGKVGKAAGLSVQEIRRRARRLAEKTIEEQEASFRDWGVMGEWDSPYKTLDVEFEVRQLEVFREMVKRGLVYRDYRPVYWSPSSRTALAEAELEYDDQHKCKAAFVKFPFLRVPRRLRECGVDEGRLSVMIWTTTPWTLPANRAIAVGREIEYCLVKLENKEDEAGSCWTVVAKSRLESVMEYLPEGFSWQVVSDDILGHELVEASNPPDAKHGNQNTKSVAAVLNVFQGTASPLILADFVTDSSGTGVVHIAPGHGMEDYKACQEYNERLGSAHGQSTGLDSSTADGRIYDTISFVDDEGRFTDGVFPTSEKGRELVGMDAQTEGVKKILELLEDMPEANGQLSTQRNVLFAAHEFVHNNPIDWRTKQPVIMRATAQWFADVSALQQPALSALESVEFLPESGRKRLESFVRGRGEWCISRQRAWGVPIPALYHKETGEHHMSESSIAHIISVIQKRGTDAWFTEPEDDPAWLIPELNPADWRRGKDTMDVWFDSGTTWSSLENQSRRPLSDVYVEGTDQHRGWFQSSLLTHVAVQSGGETKPSAPYGKVITHGFILDAEGRKMSKSLGNVIAPGQIVDGSLLPPIKAKKQKGKTSSAVGQPAASPQYDSMGPDVLRLWVASSDYTRDVSVSVQQLQEIQQMLQKYRVTFKWLLGVLSDYDASASSTIGSTEQNLTFADEAILHRLECVSRTVFESYSSYEFHRGVKEFNFFVNADLSAFYFEIVKDGLYTGSEAVRRRTQGVLTVILRETMKILAPVTPHLVEEVWEHMPHTLQHIIGEHPMRQVVTEPFKFSASQEEAEELAIAVKEFGRLSSWVKMAQEEARRDGHLKSGLACKVRIQIPFLPTDPTLARHIRHWHERGELPDLLVVSQVEVVTEKDLDLASEASGTREASQAREGQAEGSRPAPAWCYNHRIESYGKIEMNGAPGWCKDTAVYVLPPEGEKCVRCWKMTAPAPETVCQRCLDVVREKGVEIPDSV
jgi:isoleucyl-tRNA synthetase